MAQSSARTTISRALADFQSAFSAWLLTLVADEGLQVVAVDGKTTCQGHDEGAPIHMLNVFAQRPLAELLSATDCDYLFQIKNNQGDMLDAIETCFAKRGEADAIQVDQPIRKKGGVLKPVAFGAIRTTPTTVENDWDSLPAESYSVWSVWSLSEGRKLFVM